MAIETLAYKLVMDHSQFTQGSVASRKELNLAKRLMQESLTPAERMEKSLQSLAALHKKGAIDARTYASSVAKIKNSMKETTQATNANIPIVTKLTSRFAGMAPPMIAATAAFAAAGMALRELKKVAAGVADAIGSEFLEIDRIAKTSTALGFTDPGQLVTLEIAAQRAGLTVEQLETAIKRMNIQLGDAVGGTGEGAAALKLLGVSIDEIKGLAPERQFEILAGRISNLPTHIERAAAANDLFGRNGSDVLRLLGSDFDAVREEADRMRLTFDRIDAEKVEAANDAIDDLKGSISGLAREIAIEVADPLKDVVEVLKTLIELAPDANSTIRGLAGAAAGALQSAAPVLGTAAGFAGAAARDAVLEQTAARREADAAAAAAAKAEDDDAGFFEVPEETLNLSGFGTEDTFYDDMAKDIEKADKAAKKLADTIADLVRRNETPLESYNRKVEELKDLFFASDLPAATFGRELKRLREEYEETTDKSKELKNEIASNNAVLKGSADALKLEQFLAIRGDEARRPRVAGRDTTDAAVAADRPRAEDAKKTISLLSKMERHLREPITVEEVSF